MNTFGYKIVEKDRTEIEPVVAAALQQQRPIEVGLYFGDKAAWDFLQATLPQSGLAVNTHLDHRRLSLLTLVEQEALLHKQMQQAAALGSSYSVTHLHVLPIGQRPELRARLAEQLTAPLLLLERVCADYQHPVHVENVFHHLDLYRWFFEFVQQLQLHHVQHCFDLGHAKVWSRESLPEWLLWLRQQHSQGTQLHFHLHANNGLADQHLAFTEAEEQGLNACDAYTVKWNYFEVLAQLQQYFPTSRKVFEVKPQQALANMDLVLERVGGLLND